MHHYEPHNRVDKKRVREFHTALNTLPRKGKKAKQLLLQLACTISNYFDVLLSSLEAVKHAHDCICETMDKVNPYSATLGGEDLHPGGLVLLLGELPRILHGSVRLAQPLTTAGKPSPREMSPQEFRDILRALDCNLKGGHLFRLFLSEVFRTLHEIGYRKLRYCPKCNCLCIVDGRSTYCSPLCREEARGVRHREASHTEYQAIYMWERSLEWSDDPQKNKHTEGRIRQYITTYRQNRKDAGKPISNVSINKRVEQACNRLKSRFSKVVKTVRNRRTAHPKMKKKMVRS
ncbi:MAG: hypothetical protein FJ395_21365 [Verrucomicrobia bacterium]|nr:hypothetical protein [Verrucomicrobiota bacterium]